MTTPDNAIVAAIPPEGLHSGLRFAVAEAKRWKAPLHLVHVLPVPALYEGAYGGPIDKANSILEAMAGQARDLGGDDLVVTTDRKDDGWVVDDLVRAGDAGRMIVLEHHPAGPVHRIVLGSTSSGVAARATVPVVSVPAGWSPLTARRPVVTAAVQDAHEAETLIRVAFDEADSRHRPLVILHAWWLSSGYDVVVVDDAMRTEYEDQFRLQIGPLVDEIRAGRPEVEVEIKIRHAPPVEAVLDAAEASDLMVIGRRHHLLPLRTHLGPVARAALQHGEAPVLVTPQVAHSADSPAPQDRVPAAR